MVLAPQHAAPAKAPAQRTATNAGFRRDVQGLRAIAVGAVVLNHLWPNRMPGGYVGVDVFFVISGFLITTHLNKEIVSTGRLRIGTFYARRILRLLPAAFLVIATSALAAWRFLPYAQWAQNAREFLASACYVENWVLAARSVDYSAQTQAATAAQHYWSLSVEEQFYLLWPILLLGLTLLARRWFTRHRDTVVVSALGAVAAGFFVVSILVTASTPNQAYFVTPVRIWEFAIGGITALLAPRLRIPRMLAQVVAIAGLVGIVFACFAYGPNTAFPGYAAALPTLATAAVILAGTGHTRLWHDAVTGMRPVQFLGDVSYSIYLWHWPLVVIVPFALDRPLGTATKVAIIFASVLLAWLTKIFVEDPGRRWKWARAKTRRAFAAMGVGILITALASGTLLWQANREADRAAQLAAVRASGKCAGSRALDNPACPDPFGPAIDPVMGPANEYYTWPSECDPASSTVLVAGSKKTTRECDFSDGDPSAPSVWIVGDSHAEQWQGALFIIARERHWRVTTSYLGACPAAWQVKTDSSDAPPTDSCQAWQDELAKTVVKAHPDLVITSALTKTRPINDGTGRSVLEQYRAAFQAMWQPWLDAGIHVTVMADPPLTAQLRDPNCVVMNAQNPLACAVPRSAALPIDPITDAAAKTPGVTLIDLTKDFCSATTCYAVIGATPVFYDQNHLNLLYVQGLAPQIAADLPPTPATQTAHRSDG